MCIIKLETSQREQPSWAPSLFGSSVLSLNKPCFATHQKEEEEEETNKSMRYNVNR